MLGGQAGRIGRPVASDSDPACLGESRRADKRARHCFVSSALDEGETRHVDGTVIRRQKRDPPGPMAPGAPQAGVGVRIPCPGMRGLMPHATAILVGGASIME